MLAAMQTLTAIVFSSLDPLQRGGAVVCTKPDDTACAEALASGNLCALDRAAWQWQHPGEGLISDFDLVCSRRWQRYFQASVFMIALLAGALLCQLSAERHGALGGGGQRGRGLGGRLRPIAHLIAVAEERSRRPTPVHPQAHHSWFTPAPSSTPLPTPGRRRVLYTCAALAGLATILASTAPSLWLYLVFRGASAAAVGAMAVAAFAAGADVAGPSWRGFVGLLLNHFFSGKPAGAASQVSRAGRHPAAL